MAKKIDCDDHLSQKNLELRTIFFFHRAALIGQNLPLMEYKKRLLMHALSLSTQFYTMDQHQLKSIIMLLFILEAIIANRRRQDIQMQRTNIYYLLTALTTTNIATSAIQYKIATPAKS